MGELGDRHFAPRGEALPVGVGQYLDQILDALGDGVCITDRAGYVLKINRNYERLAGIQTRELVGRHVQELVDKGFFNVVLNPAIVESKTAQSVVQINKHGRTLILNGIPLLDEHDEVALVITFVRDITAITQLRKETAIQQELLEEHNVGSVALQDTALRPGSGNPEVNLTIKRFIEKVAPTDVPVLLCGETGVGKGNFAQRIHQSSRRCDRPLFKVDCASIPENLIESELFGYVAGAFSGANTRGKAGLLELADKATLFLDEIGELPLSMQAKLLRFLQDQEIVRLGSTKVQKIDVRVLAATNRNLEQEVEAGRFRRDLFFRLCVVVIDIPPLRERLDDLQVLSHHFLAQCNVRYRKRVNLSPAVERVFRDYPWPGNIRELEHLIEVLVITAETEEIGLDNLPPHFRHSAERQRLGAGPDSGKSLARLVAELEYEVLSAAMGRLGNAGAVAQSFGISRATLFRKLKQGRPAA